VRVKLFCLTIIGFISLILVTTNPSLVKHQEFAREVLTNDFDKPTNFIKALIEVVVNEKIYREDYWLFSLTKFDDLGVAKTLGIGLFGTVLPIEWIVEHKFYVIFTLFSIYYIYVLIREKSNKDS